MDDFYRFTIGLCITGGLLAWGHYFRWRNPLPRVRAYAFGVGSIFVGIWAYLGANVAYAALHALYQASTLFWRIAAFPVVAGIVVCASYFWDDHANSKEQAKVGAEQQTPS